MSKIWSCSNCGEEWEDHPAHAVTCPTCQARPGRRCKRPSEHTVFSVGYEPHVNREKVALRAGVMQMCPNGPSARTKIVINTGQLYLFNQEKE